VRVRSSEVAETWRQMSPTAVCDEYESRALQGYREFTARSRGDEIGNVNERRTAAWNDDAGDYERRDHRSIRTYTGVFLLLKHSLRTF